MNDSTDTVSSRQNRTATRGVYPPSFCRWRLLLAVMAVTQISVLLMGVARLGEFSLVWLGVASLYAQALALVTALGVCITRAWLGRLSARGAWLGSWLVAVVVALAFSYFAGIIGTVLGTGPGRQDFAVFVWQSVLAVALVGVALLRYLFIRAQWRAQVLAQSEARVQALQARIRPHFLFNSLNTIASLIPEEPVAAERAIEDLADLFRGSMRRADSLICLTEELDLARRYLQMEQRRLGDRLCVDWQVSELPQAASVLPLTLQPLLENAVAHGIQSRADGGEIRVYGRAEKDNIVITISNPLGLDEVDHKGHGMALVNIRERLELAFGPNASLITHQNDEQFFAVLSLPYVENTDY
ncbi:MAG: sensor histidine kinase [Xanthomonadales bacterium]|nr:sensor histidine kinase [Xanthomonadales bacterium]